MDEYLKAQNAVIMLRDNNAICASKEGFSIEFHGGTHFLSTDGEWYEGHNFDFPRYHATLEAAIDALEDSLLRERNRYDMHLAMSGE